MKNLLIFILVLVSSCVFSQSNLDFVKHINPDTISYTLENTDCTLIVDNYDGDYIKLSVTVESNVSENILSQLFKVGRYNISVKNGVISFDRIKKTIFINGIELNETIIVNVSLPYGITLSNQLLN